ncbi:MAG: ABC transporter permease [Holosporales bacterium]|jgi:ABC-2 type transport system permease protein|nr:ABC transporter permease [Holosporales bacterium]
MAYHDNDLKGSMLFTGVGALTKKELLSLLREPKSAFMIFFPIVLFLTIFVFATTKDVENAAIVIMNKDSGMASVNLLDKIVSTKIFKRTEYVTDEADFKKKIDTEEAFVGLSIPCDFSKKLSSGKSSDIQVVTDGRRTNAAMIVYGYISQILSKFQATTNAEEARPSVTVRTWYNPNKEQKWFSVTNLVCMIIVSQAITLTALSIAREKEEGTFDQLLVTPIKPLGMLLGKITPGALISVFMGICVMFLGHLLYGVPINGSLVMLLFCMVVFAVSVVGIGVCIAAFANTQQQAMLGTFLFQMPMTALSGLMSPTESIANPVMKIFTKCNPVMYGNILVKGIMLKNMSWAGAAESILPIIVIGIVVLATASVVFMKRHRIKVF